MVCGIAAECGLTTEQVRGEWRLRELSWDARHDELIRKARADLEALHPDEWNFDAVTDPAELAACCCWEYARESVSIRKIRAQFEHSPTVLGPDVERVLSIGALAKMFFMYPESPFQFGARAFPYPWQSLPQRRRQELAKIAMSKPAAFKVENSVWVANCLASHARALELQTAQRRGKEEGWWKQVEGCPSIRWSDGGETLIVTVNWTHRNLQDLADEFLKWAKRIRPHDLRKPNGNITTARTLRADLTYLAAMRLLSVFTPKELLGTTRSRVRGGKRGSDKHTPALRACLAVWESKQFEASKWLEVEKWRDARREARRRFRGLFPFLPKTEKPLSNQRRE